MIPARSPASSASSPCPASLVTVILANSVSQETGSDLDLLYRFAQKRALEPFVRKEVAAEYRAEGARMLAEQNAFLSEALRDPATFSDAQRSPLASGYKI